MNNQDSRSPLPQLTKCLKEFFDINSAINLSAVSITFYPFTRLTNTIRLSDKRVMLRLSDILDDAPLEVLSALVILLACKLLRLRPPEEYRKLYRYFIQLPEIQKRADSIKKKRGVKRILPARGLTFDLTSFYELLNEEYFESRLTVSQLGWSPRKAKRTLGHYDPVHNTIVINRRLDNPLVPEYVVSYVLYHEMLHAFFKPFSSNGRRRIHHAEFQKMEKCFSDYRRAKKFISKNFG